MWHSVTVITAGSMAGGSHSDSASVQNIQNPVHMADARSAGPRPGAPRGPRRSHAGALSVATP